VIAVEGWLAGDGIPVGCGPAPDPSATPVPAQFACPPEFLTLRPATPNSGNVTNITTGTIPGSVLVQEGAYQAFAPSPTMQGINDVPRLATYLLRMVVDTASNCPHCRGWLLVGRLEATPTPASAPSAFVPVVRAPDELAALLTADRASRRPRIRLSGATGNDVSVAPPSDGVRLQPAAYAEFPSARAGEDEGPGHVPRLGTYLVRMVPDPQPGANPPSGWQLVAWLEP
jgi:hypothetical protein